MLQNISVYTYNTKIQVDFMKFYENTRTSFHKNVLKSYLWKVFNLLAIFFLPQYIDHTEHKSNVKTEIPLAAQINTQHQIVNTLKVSAPHPPQQIEWVPPSNTGEWLYHL